MARFVTNHPKDRHVLAAAIRGRADVIVTSNIRDFTSEACEPYDLDVQTPDEFLSHQWEMEDTHYLLEVLEGWASRLKSPSLTLEELLETLACVVPNFSERALEAARERTSRR